MTIALIVSDFFKNINYRLLAVLIAIGVIDSLIILAIVIAIK